jgi:pimeloyl-ACP methyl ester carboxylesterase
MTINQIDVRIGSVTTEGDELYYEVRGHGLPLLMIPGGSGDGRIYSFVADILSNEYMVITYDRRANASSTRNNPQNFEISQQSRDAVAVLRAAGESSAFVFGCSSGAIIALDMAKTQPQAVRAAVVHEPPTVRVLPDSEKWLSYFASLYHGSFQFGGIISLLRFVWMLGLPLITAMRKMDLPHESASKRAADDEFFLKQELIPVINYKPDINLIKQNGVKVFMAVGKWTLDHQKVYGRTAPILAEMLGCELVIFPGHHVSYVDMPNEWAAVLRSVLHQAIGVNQ